MDPLSLILKFNSKGGGGGSSSVGAKGGSSKIKLCTFDSEPVCTAACTALNEWLVRHSGPMRSEQLVLGVSRCLAHAETYSPTADRVQVASPPAVTIVSPDLVPDRAGRMIPWDQDAAEAGRSRASSSAGPPSESSLATSFTAGAKGSPCPFTSPISRFTSWPAGGRVNYCSACTSHRRKILQFKAEVILFGVLLPVVALFYWFYDLQNDLGG